MRWSMSDSAEIGKRLSYFKPIFKRVDEDDYSAGYYVSAIVYQNDGGSWYRSISFTDPDSIGHAP